MGAQQRLGPSQRFATAYRMSETVRNLAIARIRQRNPELDDRGVLDALMANLNRFRRDT